MSDTRCRSCGVPTSEITGGSLGLPHCLRRPRSYVDSVPEVFTDVQYAGTMVRQKRQTGRHQRRNPRNMSPISRGGAPKERGGRMHCPRPYDWRVGTPEGTPLVGPPAPNSPIITDDVKLPSFHPLSVAHLRPFQQPCSPLQSSAEGC